LSLTLHDFDILKNNNLYTKTQTFVAQPSFNKTLGGPIHSEP